MAKGTVVIGCKLPHGLVLTHKGVKVILEGLNKSRIIGANYVTNQVDAEFWAAWKLENKDFEPLKSNAIFEASGVREAEDKAKELEKEKTGFEPMPKEVPGIKTATKD